MKILNENKEFESVTLKNAKRRFFETFKRNVVRNKIVVLHGMPSTGKTTFVNSRINVPVFDTDTVVPLIAGNWDTWHELCKDEDASQQERNRGALITAGALLRQCSTTGILATNFMLETCTFNYIASFGREASVMETLFEARCKAGGFHRRRHDYDRWYRDWENWVLQSDIPLVILLEGDEFISDLLPDGIATDKQPSEIKQLVDKTYVLRNECINRIFPKLKFKES